MNIVVCVKPVPDPEKYALLSIDPQTKRLNREGIPTIVNPSDRTALEAALQLKESCGGTVSVVSMTPLFSREQIKETLAMGADEAFMVSDSAFAGADTLSTSYTLMKAIEKTGIKADLILAGNESADGATAQVGAQLAEWMGLPHITNVIGIQCGEDGTDRLIVRKKTEDGAIAYHVKLPALLTVNLRACKPRFVSALGVIKAGKKRLEVFSKADLDVEDGKIGLSGSPTQPGELIQPDLSRAGQEITGDPDEIAATVVDIIKKSGVLQ